MNDKETILDNVTQYSVDELADFVKQGTVTFDELCTETYGEFTPSMRKELKLRLDNSEQTDWQEASAHPTREALEAYLIHYPDGTHRDEARNLLKEMAQQDQMQAETEKREQQEQQVWESLDKTNRKGLQQFISNYPDNEHVAEAKTLISQLQKAHRRKPGMKQLLNRISELESDTAVLDPIGATADLISDFVAKDYIEISQLIDAINHDPNLLSSQVLKRLLKNDTIYEDDIEDLQIDDRFKDYFAMTPIRPSVDLTPKKLERISKKGTEVYFWGTPASGKSCALGAILSVANNGEIARCMSQDNHCQGYHYMNLLSGVFHNTDEVCMLPPGTPTTSFYEMGFDLEDEHQHIHSLIFIDLAGELMKCMYRKDAQLPLTNNQAEALDTLTHILVDQRTDNRKVHFFVIEYGAENKLYDGLYQKDWLTGAVNYIEQTGIFQKDTDAIYVLITKADKTNATGYEREGILKDYMRNHYKGFYNKLCQLAKKEEIADGIVPIFPFSLGSVCFQDYCLFNKDTANNLVGLLLNTTCSESKSKFLKALNTLRK